MRPEGNNVLVEALGRSLQSGGQALSNVPGLLKKVLQEESWREFTTQRGELVQHNRFAEFVATPPLKGLGAEIGLLRRIVANDAEAVDLLDQTLQNPNGLHNVQAKAPTGNGQDRALRKLRKDAPELHAEVLDGSLSAHAAMVKAGFRPRTISIPVGRPESVATSLRKYMTADQIAQLIALLMKETR